MKNPIFQTNLRSFRTNLRPFRVFRGGVWSSYAQYLRISGRYDFAPTDTGSYLGFRIFRTKEKA